MVANRLASAASSTAVPRTLMAKRLPASAPRGSLREWRCASSTWYSPPRTATHSCGESRDWGTVNHCVTTARRSFSPAYPTSPGRHPQARASSRAIHWVLALRLRTLSNTCWPVPAASNPSTSSTTKPSGSTRSRPGQSGLPSARGGSSAASAGIEQKHHGLGGDPLGTPQEAELFGGRRLHVDLLDGHLEELRHLPADVVAHGRELRPLSEHRHVGIPDLQSAVAQHVHHRAHETLAVGALPAGVGILEMLTDVSQAGRSEQRIRERVQHHVSVRVRHDTVRMRHPHPAEHDEIAWAECMHVDAGADSHINSPFDVTSTRNQAKGSDSCYWLSFRSAAAIARSAALVILRFAAAPSTSPGASPSHSIACASSVGMRLAACARSSASQRRP